MKRIILIAALLITPLTVNAQASFLFGLGTGYVLGSSGDGSGGSSSAVLYTAKKEVLKDIDPMEIRQVSLDACFDDTSEIGNDYYQKGASLGEIFKHVMKDQPKVDWVVLQVVRVFNGAKPRCAAIWFTYAEDQR